MSVSHYICMFVPVLLLPAVDNLVHVVLCGEPVARLLRSAPLLALLPLLPLAVLQRRRRALPAVRGPQVDAQALVALLHVVLDALLPPLLLPGVLVALLEQVPGVVIKLHVELVQLLDALDLTWREQMGYFSWLRGREEMRDGKKKEKKEKPDKGTED